MCFKETLGCKPLRGVFLRDFWPVLALVLVRVLLLVLVQVLALVPMLALALALALVLELESNKHRLSKGGIQIYQRVLKVP
jgi:hypothetical protein